MKLAKENLGKVSVTVEKAYHSVNKEYDKLVVVEEEGQFRTFISRKPVPIGTELTDREFWLPFSSVKESIVIDYNKFKQYIRTGEGLLDDSIVTRHIKDRNVTGDKIAEATITFVNIANEAVTLPKINKEAIDTTLTKEGYLAEAKHTGDRLLNVEGLTVIKVPSTQSTVLDAWQIVDKNGNIHGVTINTYKDKSIDAIWLSIREDDPKPEDPEVKVDNPRYLNIVYNKANGTQQKVSIPLASFVTEAEFSKNGFKVIDGVVNLKISSDITTSRYFHFDADGNITLDGFEERILEDLGTLEHSQSGDGTMWGEFKKQEAVREEVSNSAHQVFSDNWDEADDNPELPQDKEVVDEASYAYNWKSTDTPASDGSIEGNLKDLYQKTLNQELNLSKLEQEHWQFGLLGMVKKTNGQFLADKAYSSSDLLPLNRNYDLVFVARAYNDAASVSFYTANGVWISSIQKSTSVATTLAKSEFPEAAVYVRFTCLTAEKSQCYYLNSPTQEAREGAVSDAIQASKLALFIDQWNAACGSYGKYNPANAPDAQHPFYLNHIWLTYKEAMNVMTAGSRQTSTLKDAYINLAIRTHLPRIGFEQAADARQTFRSCVYLETVEMPNLRLQGDVFFGCNRLRNVNWTGLPIYNLNDTANANFQGCSKLVELRGCLRSNFDFNIADSPLLSLASFQRMVDKAYNTAPITVTVHPDVYAKLTGDTTNAAAAALSADELAQWQSLVSAAAAKNIAFATTE